MQGKSNTTGSACQHKQHGVRQAQTDWHCGMLGFKGAGCSLPDDWEVLQRRMERHQNRAAAEQAAAAQDGADRQVDTKERIELPSLPSRHPSFLQASETYEDVNACGAAEGESCGQEALEEPAALGQRVSG